MIREIDLKLIVIQENSVIRKNTLTFCNIMREPWIREVYHNNCNPGKTQDLGSIT